jgi:hypothetical protein
MKRGIWLATLLVTLPSLLFAGSFGNNVSNLVTVTGTLQIGVEAGCTILRADNATEYLLLDWFNYPPPGTRVNITGYFDNNGLSYRMQGSGAIHH